MKTIIEKLEGNNHIFRKPKTNKNEIVYQIGTNYKLYCYDFGSIKVKLV